MDLRITVTAVCLLAGASACKPAPSKAAKVTLTGVVTTRAYTYLASATAECQQTPTANGCRRQWNLSVRDKAGEQHLLAVTQAVYSHCRLGAHYPTCARSRR